MGEKIVPNKLKQFRRQKYRNQKGFADIMGVHVNSYRRFETNESELPVSCAKKLGDYFKINWWELYDENDGERRSLTMTVKDLIYKLMLCHPDAEVKIDLNTGETDSERYVTDVIDCRKEVVLEYE